MVIAQGQRSPHASAPATTGRARINNQGKMMLNNKAVAHGSPAPTRREQISIDQLVLDPAFQVRNKLNDKAIRQYKEAYRLERPLDPISVAEVDGMFLLTDGWHRVTALQQLG